MPSNCRVYVRTYVRTCARVYRFQTEMRGKAQWLLNWAPWTHARTQTIKCCHFNIYQSYIYAHYGNVRIVAAVASIYYYYPISTKISVFFLAGPSSYSILAAFHSLYSSSSYTTSSLLGRIVVPLLVVVGPSPDGFESTGLALALQLSSSCYSLSWNACNQGWNVRCCSKIDFCHINSQRSSTGQT